MNARKLQALRNLAERPGTEAEGILAREILERFTKGEVPSCDEPDIWSALGAHARGDMGTVEFIQALRRWTQRSRNEPLPTTWACACGNVLSVGAKCDQRWRHLEIQTLIRSTFKKGDRVFYNRHAYSKNCTGKVAAYVKLKPENGDYPWGWISIKFDHLKGARQIPIISAAGWHLTKEPVDNVPQEYPFPSANERAAVIARGYVSWWRE